MGAPRFLGKGLRTSCLEFTHFSAVPFFDATSKTKRFISCVSCQRAIDLPRPAPLQEGSATKSHDPLGVHEYAVVVGLYAAITFLFGRRPCFRQIDRVCHPGRVRRLQRSSGLIPARRAKAPGRPHPTSASPKCAAGYRDPPWLASVGADRRAACRSTHSIRHGPNTVKGFTQ